MSELEVMIRKNPALKTLIKTFGLVDESENNNQTNKSNNNQKNNKMAKRKEKKSSLFLQIVNGKLAMFVNEPTQYSEVVKDKDGKTRNYEMFESVEGKLKQVYVYDKELDGDRTFEMLAVKVLNKEGEFEVIQLPFKSNYAKSFIARLEMINLDKDVEIKCFKILDKEKSKEKGKDIYNELLLPYQDGKSLENPYNQKGKKKLPDAKITEIKEKGVKVKKYDFSDQQEFLRELVKETNETLKERENIAPVSDKNDHSDIETDDIPF